jgi:hypothetical protein
MTSRPGEVGFGYRLTNEGTGIALNIRHGLEIAGRLIEFGSGMQMRALRPGETQPPADYLDPNGHMIQFLPLVVASALASLPEDWAMLPRYYWAEFENVFSERFRTSNPSLPDQPASFERVSVDYPGEAS